jgi:hypothetical protein
VLSKTAFDRHRERHVSNNILWTWNISIEHIPQERRMAYDIPTRLRLADNQNILFELGARDISRMRCAATWAELRKGEEEEEAAAAAAAFSSRVSGYYLSDG